MKFQKQMNMYGYQYNYVKFGVFDTTHKQAFFH